MDEMLEQLSEFGATIIFGTDQYGCKYVSITAEGVAVSRTWILESQLQKGFLERTFYIACKQFLIAMDDKKKKDYDNDY